MVIHYFPLLSVNLRSVKLFLKLHMLNVQCANSSFERTLSTTRHASSHPAKMPGSISCFCRCPTTHTYKCQIYNSSLSCANYNQCLAIFSTFYSLNSQPPSQTFILYWISTVYTIQRQHNFSGAIQPCLVY